MFDIQYQCKTITNTLTGIAKGTRSRRKKLRAKAGKARQDTDLADRIVLALQAAVGVRALADDIRMLTNYADTGGLIKVSILWQSDHGAAEYGAAPSEQSFSPIGTVTRSVLDNFLDRINHNQLINDLPLLLDELDITHNGERQGSDNVNQRRYVLDNLSYLKAWQAATTENTETGEIVRTAVGENDPAQSAQIEMRIAEHMDLLQRLID